MFKPVVVTPDTVREQAQQPMPVEVVNNIFKVFHGFYGNLFLSKFATGEVGAAGDAGIVSAREIWGHGLRKFNPGTVKAALSKCMEAHPEYPPSLPQFVALCAACAPREAYKPAQPAVTMSPELRSTYTARAREITARHAKEAAERRLGIVELPDGLEGLCQAIANAVATAGGDEVAELARLDRIFEVRHG